MWQPEQPPSQTVASFRRSIAFFSRAVTRKARTPRSRRDLGNGRALGEDGAGRARLEALAARGAGRRGAPGLIQVGDDPRLGAPAGDVPGVGALDLVAGPHAARAEDAAVVVDAESGMAQVDLADWVAGNRSGRGPRPARSPGPGARSGCWRRRPSRRDCARPAAARRSCGDTRAAAGCRSGSSCPPRHGSRRRASSRPLPEILDQAEPAGADVRRPLQVASVGIAMPASRAASRIVWSVERARGACR